ncbi:hypothetical protein Bbelb_303550 [Branchiostoma belcheri]|nr:hypothetical protein Bbelb_303550 [Branchiostoma belcheri]
MALLTSSSVGNHASNNEDLDKHVSNNDDSGNHASNNDDLDKHVSNNDDSGNHASNNDDLDKHLSNNDDSGNHASNNDDLDKHLSNNDDSGNNVYNNDDLDKHVSNNDDPDNHEYNIDDSDNHEYDYEPSGRQPKVKDDSKKANICCFVRGVAIAVAVVALVGAGLSAVIFITLSLESDIVSRPVNYNNSCCTKLNIDNMKDGPVFSTTTFTWKITSCSGTSGTGPRELSTVLSEVTPTPTLPRPTEETTERQTLPNTTKKSCPKGYVYHQPNRLCYKAFNDRTTYNGAVRGCSLDGGTLAMPRDTATNNFLIDLKNDVDKNSYFRFGLTDDNQEGVWMWDDNVPLGDFTAWGAGQPDNWYGDEDCAEYYAESSSFSNSWNDGYCAHTNRKFICQVSPSASCPGYREFRGTCYKAFGIWKDFWAADNHCRRDADGGSLAMPKDAATNDFLLSLIRGFNEYFYFGLHDLTEEGRFQWVDGTKLGRFKFWNPGEPNNGGRGQDCVRYNWEGKWDDYCCNKERYFLCQVAPGHT